MKVIVSTKGGVGKSVIATQILPLVIEKDLTIIEVDNNNKTVLQNSNIEILQHSAEDGVKAVEEAIFKSYAEDKEVLIDAGGGDDTKKVLKALQKSGIAKDIEYYIPTNSDLEQQKNIIDTVELIRSIAKEAQINLILNRAKGSTKEDIEEQFLNVFGSKRYNVKGVDLKVFSNLYVIEDNNIVQVVKNIYKTTIKELLQNNKEMLETDKSKLYANWTKEGKEAFTQKYALLMLLQDANEFAQKVQSVFSK